MNGSRQTVRYLVLPLGLLLFWAAGCTFDSLGLPPSDAPAGGDVTVDGGCGGACKADEICSAGKCVPSCKADETLCSGACVNLQSDPQNCGACGGTCGAGEVCSAGACAQGCTGGKTNCSGSCADLQTDANNCGTCGVQCAEGNTACCAGTCVDLSTDAKNCGVCGTQFSLVGKVCCSGACADLNTDASNCGTCGTTCASLGKVCCVGACADIASDAKNCGNCGVQCDPGKSCCGKACVDLTTDAKNCGSCGAACGAGKVCCGKACADLTSDAKNCGACGTACGAGKVCCAGACVDLTSDAKNCGTCATACATGVTCTAGICGCCGLKACPAKSCKDLLSKACATKDGLYWMDPWGKGGAAVFQAYCNMTTFGGGWTLVARIRGDSKAHGSAGAVGTLTSPGQTTVAKLSDDQINGMAHSMYLLHCMGFSDFLKYNKGWSSAADSSSPLWTGHHKCGDWVCTAKGAWVYNTKTSVNDKGGGSWPDFDGLLYLADNNNGCFRYGSGRDGALWIK